MRRVRAPDPNDVEDRMSEKQAFLQAWDREAATTLKVLRAFPSEKTDMKPHPSCRSAKDLAWTFVFEGVAGAPSKQGVRKFPPPNNPPTAGDWLGQGRRDGKELKGVRGTRGKVGAGHA